jgi:hypothetical protein
LLTSPGLAFLASAGACGRLIMPSRRRATATAATRAPDAASRLLDAGMDGEDINQAGNGKNSQHLVLRGGQLQVTPGAPGLLPDTQPDDSPSVAAGTQIYADHRSAFLLQQQGGDSTQRLVRQLSL